MPLFNDRRNTNAPKPNGPNDNADPRNNPLSPKFTGTKTPISGKPGEFTVLNKGAKPPTPAKPVNRYTEQNNYLNKEYTTRSRQFGVPGNTTFASKINTLSGLIKKVGPDSPRYPQLVGAKARQVAGYMKLTDKPTKVDKGVSTRIMATNRQPRNAKDLITSRPGAFDPATTDPSGNKNYGFYNKNRQVQVAQAKTDATNQFKSRKWIMGYGDNSSSSSPQNKK
jgi:hypothetical protein